MPYDDVRTLDDYCGTFEYSSKPVCDTSYIGRGDDKGQTRRGSFKPLKDDRLMFVMATDETDYPMKLDSNEPTSHILAVFAKR